jgi:glycosyltransferase involved in cell wall biosynthesis
VNIFVIPSWYPSDSNPIYGTFVQEQIELMSKVDSALQFGVSIWGQGEEPFLLYVRQPFRSLWKRVNGKGSDQEFQAGSIRHLHSNAFIWTRKFLSGNMEGIVKANERNLARYIELVGQVDLIHVQASYPGAWIAYQLARKYNIPYIVTLRMSPFPFAEYLGRVGQLDENLARVLGSAHRLIATSDALKTRAEELGLHKIEVVNNPVDLELFQPGESLVNAYRCLAVGRLEEQKGFDLLIKSMALLPEELPWKLDIVGEGSCRSDLEMLIAALGFEDRITLLGELDREAVVRSMQGCDLFVLSSRHETFGNVVVEAMACGKPVVATRCGGPSSILTNDTGILCSTEDIHDLSGAIKTALMRPWDAVLIRSYAVEHYAPAIFTQRMKSIYSAVIK